MQTVPIDPEILKMSQLSRQLFAEAKLAKVQKKKLLFFSPFDVVSDDCFQVLLPSQTPELQVRSFAVPRFFDEKQTKNKQKQKKKKKKSHKKTFFKEPERPKLNINYLQAVMVEAIEDFGGSSHPSTLAM